MYLSYVDAPHQPSSAPLVMSSGDWVYGPQFACPEQSQSIMQILRYGLHRQIYKIYVEEGSTPVCYLIVWLQWKCIYYSGVAYTSKSLFITFFQFVFTFIPYEFSCLNQTATIRIYKFVNYSHIWSIFYELSIICCIDLMLTNCNSFWKFKGKYKESKTNIKSGSCHRYASFIIAISLQCEIASIRSRSNTKTIHSFMQNMWWKGCSKHSNNNNTQLTHRKINNVAANAFEYIVMWILFGWESCGRMHSSRDECSQQVYVMELLRVLWWWNMLFVEWVYVKLKHTFEKMVRVLWCLVSVSHVRICNIHSMSSDLNRWIGILSGLLRLDYYTENIDEWKSKFVFEIGL